MKLDSYIERLNVFFEERRGMPYVWGTNDCVTYAADGVLAMTGVDPIADLRGAWNDEPTAMSVLENLGGLITAVNARLPVRENLRMAMRGDVALVRDANGRPSLAICMGMWCAAPGIEETLMVPRSKMRRVWEI